MFAMLKQPYPVIDDSKKILSKIAVIVFVFVFFFLVLFKPFNLEQVLRVDICWAALIFAMLSTFCYVSYVKLALYFFPRTIVDEKWTIGKEFVFVNGILLFVSVGNTILRTFVAPTPENSLFVNVVNDLFYTYTIGVFPVMVAIVMRYIILLKRNSKVSLIVNEPINLNTPIIKEKAYFTITSVAKNNDIDLHLDSLVYLKSEGNYIEFYLENEDENKLVRLVRRNTLGNIERQLCDHPNFFRTHRKYMINLSKIINITGNAQGYKLTLPKATEIIPVSRGKLPAFNTLNKKKF